MARMPVFATVDKYIASFPRDVQAILRTMRKAVKTAVPEADEAIRYGMPGYRFHGALVYFAAFRAHYSFFAASPDIRRIFAKDLARYETSKGTIRLPYGKPVPVRLVQRITRYRAKENLAKAEAKAAKRRRR